MELSVLIDELRNEMMKIKGNLFSQISKKLNFENKKQYQPNLNQLQNEQSLKNEILIQVSEIRALLTTT